LAAARLARLHRRGRDRDAGLPLLRPACGRAACNGLCAASLIARPLGRECVLFALALGLAERAARPHELRVWQVGLAIVVGVVLSVLVWHAFTLVVLRNEFGMRLFREQVAGPVDWTAGMLYHGWLMLFFGGLAAVVTASQRSRRRMLSALRAAELGRATSQQRLAEARLATLEARVDPDYLYRTLSRLESLYEDDSPAADRLLDELIAFLRNALAETRGPILKEVP
jgi:hypothetical protein